MNKPRSITIAEFTVRLQGKPQIRKAVSNSDYGDHQKKNKKKYSLKDNRGWFRQISAVRTAMVSDPVIDRQPIIIAEYPVEYYI